MGEKRRANLLDKSHVPGMTPQEDRPRCCMLSMQTISPRLIDEAWRGCFDNHDYIVPPPPLCPIRVDPGRIIPLGPYANMDCQALCSPADGRASTLVYRVVSWAMACRSTLTGRR